MKQGLLVVGLVLAVAACGDDPMASSGSTLTRQEALAIARNIEVSGAAAAVPSANQAGDAVNAPPIPFSAHQDSSFPCPVAGKVSASVTIALQLDASARSVVLNAAGSLKHDHCGFKYEDVTFTVTGDPDIDFDAHSEVSGSAAAGSTTSSAKGAFNWTASDGRSGHCVLDIRSTTELSTKKHTTQGQVCGFDVNETVTWP